MKVDIREISFVVNGSRLVGHVFRPEGQAKGLAFLLIHGWQGHENVAAAEGLARHGFTAMSFYMRGNQGSEGNISKLTRADFLDDVTAAYDYLSELVGDGAEIGVIGSSFGSYMAVLLTKRRGVKCLSLRVPANYPDNDFDKPQLPQASSNATLSWRELPQTCKDNSALAALHDFGGNVQIIQAENDEQVCRQTTNNYLTTAKVQHLEHEIMKNAPHGLVNEALNTEYQSLLLAWANKQA